MILVDTDVLIDLALDRDPHVGPASELFDFLEIHRRRAFVAWHSLSNFYYLVSPGRGSPPPGRVAPTPASGRDRCAYSGALAWFRP